MNVLRQRLVARVRFVAVLLGAGRHAAVREAVVHVRHMLVRALLQL